MPRFCPCSALAFIRLSVVFLFFTSSLPFTIHTLIIVWCLKSHLIDFCVGVIVIYFPGSRLPSFHLLFLSVHSSYEPLESIWCAMMVCLCVAGIISLASTSTAKQSHLITLPHVMYARRQVTPLPHESFNCDRRSSFAHHTSQTLILISPNNKTLTDESTTLSNSLIWYENNSANSTELHYLLTISVSFDTMYPLSRISFVWRCVSQVINTAHRREHTICPNAHRTGFAIGCLNSVSTSVPCSPLTSIIRLRASESVCVHRMSFNLQLKMLRCLM